jgi:hypothetical protein
MTETILAIQTGAGSRQVELASYLDPELEEAALSESHAWIKRLRHIEVDGAPFRRRFTFRGDSLWWFTELYLHKQQVIVGIFRAIKALESLLARERPTLVHLVDGDRIARMVTPQVAQRNQVRFSGRTSSALASTARLAALDARATWLHASAYASRIRAARPASPSEPAAIAAFVHRAFWKADVGDGSAEAYIGPVLRALEDRLGEGVRYVGIGPQKNFRARRWWHPVVSRPSVAAATPIEMFASYRALAPSRAIRRRRHRFRRLMWRSPALREAARIDGVDCWPIVREELAGVALLQWPWSARAMDEAGAALDALRPAAALTYAEAGGWGRALILECRRRGIPTAGFQHGFIYRHWLNYLHEPDEMSSDPANPEDAGFPRPSLTLLFDAYAAEHLAGPGCFPANALTVTGSPRLDELLKVTSALSADDDRRARAAAGVSGSDVLVLVATKYKEARRVLGDLLDGVARVPNVHVAIKTHPAETERVYADVVKRRKHVSVLPASAPLAPLLRVSRALVTVNSTVALDAAVLGVPTLVIGLPNNLTPFVDAGLMTGARPGETAAMLERILYDEEFRQHLEQTRGELLLRFAIQSDGAASRRAADAVLALASRPLHRGS